jgi:crossover junction endodeoxyribonuclease RuvC
MLKSILAFRDEKIPLDATDALGAALCHFYQSNKPAAAKGFKSWEEYVRKNSDKVK